MPANTPIKVCSRASVLMGGSPISSFDEGTAEAEVVDAMYEDIARAALTKYALAICYKPTSIKPFSCCPTSRYDAAYQMPSDLLMLSTVTVNDDPIIYDTYGDKVYCDMSTNEVVIADYIYRASESSWPSYFTLAVEFQVAAMLSISIARDPSLAQMMDQQGERQMIKARRLDSQQQTTRKLMTSRFIAQRRS